MNEEHKKRGIMHSKFFTAVAISALLLGSSNVMATQTAESSIYGVAEQLQTITVTGVVLDATGEPIIGASVVEKGTTNGGITDINARSCAENIICRLSNTRSESRQNYENHLERG